MAHLCSVYPFTPTPPSASEVLMGANVTAGFAGFFFDPFEFYAQGHLTNPNVIVMGSVGFGKSATVKALIRRLKAVYGDGRYLAIIDPKGEYGPVAADLGLAVVRLQPGGSSGSTRWTPPAATATTRSSPVSPSPPNSWPGCSAATWPRWRTPCWAGRSSNAAAPDSRSMRDLCGRSSTHPTSWSACPTTPRAGPNRPGRWSGQAVRPHLRGMFSGLTTIRRLGHGPGVVVDLSAPSTQNTDALDW